MTDKSKDQTFTPREAQERFEAALRGARIAGPKHRPAVKIAKKKQRKKRT